MLPQLSRVMHAPTKNINTLPSSFLPLYHSIISLSLSVTHTHQHTRTQTHTHTLSELWVSASCGDNVCAVLWWCRQQSVCKKRKWCCIPRRSRVPGKNVYPVHRLWSFTLNHFLHTVYELSSFALPCQAAGDSGKERGGEAILDFLNPKKKMV